MTPGSGAHSRPRPVTIELAAQQPFDGRGLFEFLAARALPGVESVSNIGSALRYARTVQGDSGPAAFEVLFTPDEQTAGTGAGEPTAPGSWHATATIDAADPADVAAITQRIGHLLDLKADAPRIDAALARDATLTPLVRAHPGTRVPGAVDPAELVIRAIVGQQISVAAALGHLARLAERAGSSAAFDPRTFSTLTTLFPTPTQILAAVPHIGPREHLDPERALRLPRRQSNAVRAAAELLAAGGLDTHPGATTGLLTRQLTALPGVGGWTAAYVALRVSGDPDAWMFGDVALAAGARNIGLLPATRTGSKQAEQRTLALRAESWSPWRAYASMHLWRAPAPPTLSPRPARATPPSKSEEPRNAAR